MAALKSQLLKGNAHHQRSVIARTVWILPSMILVHALYAQRADGHLMPRSVMLPPGTTRAISSIFKGRCNDFVDCTLPHRSQCDNDPGSSEVNCTASLASFLEAFAEVDPCSVPDDAYDPLLEDNMVYSQRDETLFWSGTMEIAINVATVTNRYTTIERTLAGYVLNGLQWCGRATGMNSSAPCPRCPDGAPDATYQFWRAASRHFAAQAKGIVSLLLNSNREGGAFRNTSTFATQELPNIDMTLVTHVNIHLVRNVNLPDDYTRENCTSGSVLVLRSMLEQKGLNYTCTEDDIEFIIIQCVEYPDALPCQRFNSSPMLAYSVPSLLLICLLSRLFQSS